MFRYDWPRKRMYIAGRRIHHGPVGVCIALIGIGLALHDRHDFDEWFGL